jgi:hypothetical protein
MITEQNFAPGNAGIIFLSDIIVPVIGFVFLSLQYRYAREDRSAAPYPWLRVTAPLHSQ